MIGRTNAGRSGTSLNFKVVGNPQPAVPKENTIWVDTDEKITGWIFSATQPETAAEGAVWIQTGTDSPVAFNALKKNGVMVYPTSAKQYIGGAWVTKTAMSYQGGAWRNWIMTLYDYGDLREAVTGGWEKKNRSASSSATGSMTKNADNIYIKNVNGGSTGAVTVDQIDLTGYSEVHCICKANKCYIGIAAAFPASSYVASGAYEDVTADSEIVLDISAVEGMMRICISEGSVTGMYIYKVWLT